MKYTLKLTALALVAATLSGCVRVESGHIGIRRDINKQIVPTELQPGSWNQVIIGDVLTVPVKDVAVKIEDLSPVAKDNSTMKDFDLVVIYNVNPNSGAELYTTKNSAFHAYDGSDSYLMYNYIVNVARNAVYKSARKYEALDMNDARPAIEQEVKELIVKSLEEEHLATDLTISQVMVKSIVPADSIVQSANELVRAKNSYKQKEIEVQTAKQEAERISVLNSNSGAIEYMQAMAMMNISEGIKEGKVQTIVVPSNFTALMMK
jgi:hypothetical protein